MYMYIFVIKNNWNLTWANFANMIANMIEEPIKHTYKSWELWFDSHAWALTNGRKSYDFQHGSNVN